MKFNTAKEMLEYIRESNGLYNVKTHEYVFEYNAEGSICVYSLSTEEATSVSKLAHEHDDYWGAFLGWHGSAIYDNPDNIDWCKDNYAIDGWIDIYDGKEWLIIQDEVIVLSKIKNVWTLRHIICDIEETETLDNIKEKYYKLYNKTKTDRFIRCNTNKDVSKVLKKCGIKK